MSVNERISQVAQEAKWRFGEAIGILLYGRGHGIYRAAVLALGRARKDATEIETCHYSIVKRDIRIEELKGEVNELKASISRVNAALNMPVHIGAHDCPSTCPRKPR